VTELSAFLHLRLEVRQESGGRLCAEFLTAVTGRGGLRVSVLGHESRSMIHAETEISVDVRLK
jgi:hypothetical protein